MPLMTNAQNDTNLVPVSVPGAAPIMAVQKDGETWASPRHICDALGIDWAGQFTKLKKKSWARVELISMHDSSGRKQEISMVDRRTLTMWLATIDTNRVAEDARPVLEAYQVEAADALDRYFHDGGAINPRADEHKIRALMFQCQAQMELVQAARGVIHPDHLEAKARIILAQGMGEAPELDPQRRPLYAHTFLKEKNLSAKQMRKRAGTFGKKLKAAYADRHGRTPGKYPLQLGNGQIRDVYAYTEADRPLMESVWNSMPKVVA